MSDFKKRCKASLSAHARERLIERTSITELELALILENDRAVTIGNEYPGSRHSRLVFSPADKNFFVVVQDISDGLVVTILTVEYWNNLSEKHFDRGLTKISSSWQKENGCVPWKREISQKELQLAVSLSSNPENPIVRKSRDSSVLYLTGRFETSEGIKILNFGSISTNKLLGPNNSLVEAELNEKIKNKLSSKNISEHDFICFFWKFKHDEAPVSFDCLGKLDTKNLLNAMRSEISKRLD